MDISGQLLLTFVINFKVMMEYKRMPNKLRIYSIVKRKMVTVNLLSGPKRNG